MPDGVRPPPDVKDSLRIGLLEKLIEHIDGLSFPDRSACMMCEGFGPVSNVSVVKVTRSLQVK